MATSSLADLNGWLDAFIPLTQKAKAAKEEALEKETEALNKILGRLWLVMSSLEGEGEFYCRNKIDLIDQTREVVTGEGDGFKFTNKLTMYQDGAFTRSFAIEHWGQGPTFEFKDEKEISATDAIRCFGFQTIVTGLVDALKNQPMSIRLAEYEDRIKQADSILVGLREKLHQECRAAGEVIPEQEVRN